MSLMISCREAGALLEKKSLSTLTRGEQIRLGFHLRLCTICRLYAKTKQQFDEQLANSLKKVYPNEQ